MFALDHSSEVLLWETSPPRSLIGLPQLETLLSNTSPRGPKQNIGKGLIITTKIIA